MTFMTPYESLLATPGLRIDASGSSPSAASPLATPGIAIQQRGAGMPSNALQAPQTGGQAVRGISVQPSVQPSPAAVQGLTTPGGGYVSTDPAVRQAVADMVGKPVPSTETAPGTFSAKGLSDFYNQRMEAALPDYLKAQQDYAKAVQAASQMQAPDYGSLYSERYSASVAPIDAEMQRLKTSVDSIDASLRSIEDDVRAEVGGRAPESVIMAEVARRAKPLTLQRQAIADQYDTLNARRTAETQSIDKSLGFAQQSFQDQQALSKVRTDLAKSSMDQFTSLIEKGAAATDKERDDFRSIFTSLLTNAPDALRTATEEELAQLRQGFVPLTLMNKIGDTLKEQQLAKGATASQVLNRASQIQTIASSQGRYMTAEEAIAQAQAEFGALGGQQQAPQGYQAPGGGSVAYRTNNPGNIKFGAFAKSMGGVDSGIKATDGGTFAMFPDYDAGRRAQMALLTSGSYKDLTVEQAMRRWSNSGYGADVAKGAIAGNRKMSSLSQGELSTLADAMQEREGYYGPQGQQKQSKFTPEFYSTALGQKTLDNEMSARAKFEANPIVKEYVGVQDNLDSMRNIIKAGVRGPEDLALVFAFMKSLDPTSVVRESEYDAAARSGNIFSGVFAKFNGYLKEDGGSLPENVRQGFIKVAEQRLAAKQRQYDSYAKQTRSIAEKQGLNPDNVAVEFTLPPLMGGYKAGQVYEI